MRQSTSGLALARRLRRILCPRVQDLPHNLGSMLLAAVRENNDAEPPLRDEPDIDRGAWQPAVLVDDGEVAGADESARRGLA
jgi:hypothetical protein